MSEQGLDEMLQAIKFGAEQRKRHEMERRFCQECQGLGLVGRDHENCDACNGCGWEYREAPDA